MTTNLNYEYTCKITTETYVDDSTPVVFDTSESDAGPFTWFMKRKTNKDVNSVEFDGTELSTVPSTLFTTFPNLRSATFTLNGLTTWKREYLRGASNLRRLDITKNPITSLSEDAFAEIPLLEQLVFLKCQLTTIKPEVFSHFSNMKELFLMENPLGVNLPANVFDGIAHSVTTIDIGLTNMTSIPAGMFTKCSKLKRLGVENKNQAPIDFSSTFPDSLKEVWVIGEIIMFTAR